MRLFTVLISFVLFLSLVLTPAGAQSPLKVKVVPVAGGWQMQADGKPYYIKGAGGGNPLDLLRASGGNSIRTWGVDDRTTPLLLDAAQKRGLTVTLGIWLGHKEHGFKYDDPKMVAEQLEQCRKAVLKYRNHPALLMWGLGNEMEGDGQDPNVWKAVEDIAKMVHELDPNHPVTTVVAEIGSEKAKNIAKYAPSVDVLGVNSYGGLISMPERLQKQGWTKPFVVTEFGPRGPWEVKKTTWGAALESSSTEKAQFYSLSYRQSIAEQKACIGSYVFLWGDKMEGTHTWFGMLLPGTGERLGAVEAISTLWTGEKPKNRVPEIMNPFVTAAQTVLSETDAFPILEFVAKDADGDSLWVRWEIRTEEIPANEPVTQIVQSGYGILGKQSKGDWQMYRLADIKTPKTTGAYRLFLYVSDGKAGAATANVPFFVGTPPQTAKTP